MNRIDHLTAMRKHLSLNPCLLVALISVEAPAQVPSLPEGAESELVMEDLEVLALYVSSDRATVTERIPDSLQLLTVGEAASESAGPLPTDLPTAIGVWVCPTLRKNL